MSTITETVQYLTFELGQEQFGIDVKSIKEILELIPITRIPRTPDYMKGVINVRGSVVPVIDLRLKFGLPEKEQTVDTCIVVIEINTEGGDVLIGALVDGVQEVLELSADSIEPVPRAGTNADTASLEGIGKRNDEFIMILNVHRVFSDADLALVPEGGA